MSTPADAALSDRHLRLLVELLAEGLDVEVRVTGESMWPFLRSGDLVALTPPGGRVGLGDVVAILDDGPRLTVHRVVELRAGTVVTRGDARWDTDAAVAGNRVLGRVVGIRRGGRPVRRGLGPERRILAWLSRRGWLAPLARRLVPGQGRSSATGSSTPASGRKPSS